MSHEAPAYGIWTLVLINVAVFTIFAYSFVRPRSARDWRAFGAFTSFLVALFAEMYGFPLTIYLLAGWLERRYPGLDLVSHDTGHLWQTLFGWRGNPHWSPLHLLSNLLIAGGFILLARAWPALYAAQQRHALATNGPYTYVRHPQYVAFVVIMFGFLLQWPTLVTLIMFPILTWAYVRLAQREERDVRVEFGEAYARYAATTPAFVPRFGRRYRRDAQRARGAHP
jgi:protein-S-isoprenylcysteine O-methyltransferase Ste14